MAEKLGAMAYLVDDAKSLDRSWFAHDSRVGVSSGASTPEHLVKDVLLLFEQWGVAFADTADPISEGIEFKLPPELGIQQ